MQNFSLSLQRVLLACLLFLLPAFACAVDLVVIVSARSPVLSLDPAQVADIFLGKKARFLDGAEAIALDQNVGTPIRDAFYQKVMAKSPPLVKAYWSKMIFTGRGQPPKEISSNAAIRKLVAENPAFIGYIDKTTLDPSVRVVLTVH